MYGPKKLFLMVQRKLKVGKVAIFKKNDKIIKIKESGRF
jgi:hypothetical protein